MSENSQVFSLLEHTCSHHHPKTVERLVRRIMALVMELLPLQVDLEDLTSPTSSILTTSVIDTFKKAGGDYDHIVPYALLEARRRFKSKSFKELSDSGEYGARATCCEALARKLVSRLELHSQYGVLSARYTCLPDGEEESIPASALELAVDQQCTFFLSSNESQRVIIALWKGNLIQSISESGGIEYRLKNQKGKSFLDHFDSARLAVPRYQFLFRFLLWFIFMVSFSAALQTNNSFGFEDYVLNIQLFGYIIEELVGIYKIRSSQAFGFWNGINWLIFTLLSVAFAYRVADAQCSSDDQSAVYRKLAFQIMSLAAPLIWIKLLTIFDIFQYFGTLQLVLRRMIYESSIFFLLIALLGIGFFQALAGLDAVDGSNDSTAMVFDSLLLAVLGSPQFELYGRDTSAYPFNTILYYSWTSLVIILLLNILIALFGSAYSASIDEAVEVYMAFFAAKTIAAIRAPDQFVYVAPLNLIEVFFIAPLEFVVSPPLYSKINKAVMSIIFFLPLSIIALYESRFDTARRREYLALLAEPDEFTEEDEDPQAAYVTDEFGQGEDREMILSKHSFAELKASLPSLVRSPEAEILYQISELRKEIAELRGKKE